MGDGQMMSELYQENMKRQDKNRKWKDTAALPFIPGGWILEGRGGLPLHPWERSCPQPCILMESLADIFLIFMYNSP